MRMEGTLRYVEDQQTALRATPAAPASAAPAPPPLLSLSNQMLLPPLRRFRHRPFYHARRLDRVNPDHRWPKQQGGQDTRPSSVRWEHQEQHSLRRLVPADEKQDAS